jgi:hypothetical protein
VNGGLLSRQCISILWSSTVGMGDQTYLFGFIVIIRSSSIGYDVDEIVGTYDSLSYSTPFSGTLPFDIPCSECSL